MRKNVTKYKNAMKKYFTLITFLISSFLLRAQKTFPPTAEMEWKIVDVPTNVASHYDECFSQSHSAGTIYMNEEEAIVPVRFKKNKHGLVKLNKDGRVLWQSPLDGTIKGVAKFKGNILVLLADVKSNDIENLYVTTADTRTGKVAAKKQVFANPDGVVVDPYLQKTAAGEFNQLFIRTTAEKIKKRDWKIDHVLTNSRLHTISLNEDLSIKQAQQLNFPAPPEAYFIGSVLNEAGELFVATSMPDQVVVYKYTASGVVESKLMAPYSARYGYSHFPVLKADKSNSQSLFLALHFPNKEKDMVNQIYKFDFSNKKVTTTGVEALNKEYAKSIELQKLEGSQRSRFIKRTEDLAVVGIVQKDDKIVVVKEMKSVETSANDAAIYNNEAIIVSFYDHNLKLIKNIGIDKKYSSFGRFSYTLGMHTKGDSLYLTSGVITGPATYGNYLCAVNTQKMTVEKLALLDRAGIGNKSAEGDATLWFPDAFLLNIDVLNGFMSIDINTLLQKTEY